MQHGKRGRYGDTMTFCVFKNEAPDPHRCNPELTAEGLDGRPMPEGTEPGARRRQTSRIRDAVITLPLLAGLRRHIRKRGSMS